MGLYYYSQSGGYYCTCEPGWTGINCNIFIDECTMHFCLNGGTCIEDMYNITCSCPPGYTGTNERISVYIVLVKLYKYIWNTNILSHLQYITCFLAYYKHEIKQFCSLFFICNHTLLNYFSLTFWFDRKLVLKLNFL